MEPIGLMHIEQVVFPRELVEDVYKQLIETGQQGYERLALCAGDKKGPLFTITHILYPKQYLKKSELGVSFYVEGEELERIDNWLFENGKRLIAQIHSHPNEAYHSEADDAMAIITTFGGLSLVIPDFGTSDTYFEKSAVYRLLPPGAWNALSQQEVRTLIKIID